MTTPAAWNVLRSADRSELVLACDFSAAGRPIAGFADLTGLLTTECTLWETAPPPPEEAARMTGADQVARWAADVRAAAIPVRAVLGFCTGALYAGALAEEIAGRQPRPRLILLDPEPVRTQAMLGFYESLVGERFASVLSPAEAEEALHEARRLAGAYGPTELAHRFGTLLGGVVESAFARLGLPGGRVAEFTGLSLSYLYWLGAADACAMRGPWASATAVNGTTPGMGLDSFAPAERAGLVERAFHLDVSHADLMRSAETARLVDDLLSDDPLSREQGELTWTIPTPPGPTS
ncbi:hypothetical protein R1Y80_03955 [Streptomyces sp. JL1001]|uniref:Thioesterase domain-containing protein n=1 Tax=Streptomyces sp. JL1001 TaxID=3078227 RepID=A0AAU8K9A3_9ACTN